MRRRLCALVCVLALFCAAAGCSNRQTQGESITLWFLSQIADDLGVDPLVSAEITVGRNADKVTAAMLALLQGTGDHQSPYLEGVQVAGITYDGGEVTIDFNERYLEMEGVELAGAEACATLTLCGIDGVTGVSFTVSGQPYMTGGRSMLEVEDIVTGDLSLKPVEREVSVYFSDGNTQYVVKETRNVVLRETALLERYAIDELIKGPNDSSLASTLPEGTSVLSVSTEQRVCIVNFSEEFEQIMEYPLAERIQTLFAVTSTICGGGDVDCVQYYVDGERLFDGPMYKNDIAEGKFVDNAIDCTVYLPSDDGKGAVGVLMRVETGGGFDINRLLCERLATGIDGNGFMSALPRGTRVNGVSIANGIATINFSLEFAQNEPPDGVSRELMENTIALTLASTNEGVEAVTFLVEGEIYGGGRVVQADFSLVRSER